MTIITRDFLYSGQSLPAGTRNGLINCPACQPSQLLEGLSNHCFKPNPSTCRVDETRGGVLQEGQFRAL